MKFKQLLAAACLASVATGLGVLGVSAETIRFPNTLARSDTPETKALDVFKEYVEFASNGDLDVQLIQGGVGGDREILEGVQTGLFQIASTADGALAGFYPKIQFFSIPYLFASTSVAVEFMRNSELMATLADDMAEQTGLRPIAYGSEGFRNFVNNAHPIKTPEDLKGLKMRSMESPVMMRLMTSLGAAPTPIPYTESAMAIRQGVVDGGENPPPTVINGGWADVIKYMSLDEHIFSATIVTVNDDWLSGLEDKNRKVVIDGLKLFANVMLAEKQIAYLGDVKKIEDKGVEVYVNTADEKAEFRSVAQQPVVDFLNGEIGADFVKSVQDAVKEAEKATYGK